MKKVLVVLLAAIMVLAMVGCGSPAQPQKSDDAGAANGGDKYELALITDVGTIDDKSFNQGAWEGLEKYAKEHDISHKYYKPKEKSNDAYLESIKMAVDAGAKVIVTPGYLFEVPIYQAQAEYPDVTFVLLDGQPNDGNQDDPKYETANNTVCILYAEEQAGFFAGYAAVRDGFRKLGFQGGMAVPAVKRFGHGFVMGADAAAIELGLKEGEDRKSVV